MGDFEEGQRSIFSGRGDLAKILFCTNSVEPTLTNSRMLYCSIFNALVFAPENMQVADSVVISYRLSPFQSCPS